MQTYNCRTAEQLQKHIGFPVSVSVFPEIDSTNLYALRSCPPSDSRWSLLVAEQQTAGKGRMERSFYSPPGTGIYMSLCFRCEQDSSCLPFLPTMAACAVMYAIKEKTGIQTGLKWVNDVYLNGRKICGILVQSKSVPEESPLIVVGIGLNVMDPPHGYPDELQQKAGSLFGTSLPSASREELIVSIANHFRQLFDRLPNTDYLNSYRENCFLLGREILVRRLATGEEFPATADFIDEKGALHVLYPDGRREALFYGEISILENK